MVGLVCDPVPWLDVPWLDMLLLALFCSLLRDLPIWALVPRVGNVRFHIYRSTNVRFRVRVS